MSSWQMRQRDAWRALDEGWKRQRGSHCPLTSWIPHFFHLNTATEMNFLFSYVLGPGKLSGRKEMKEGDSLIRGLCDLLVTGRWHFWLLKERRPSGNLSVVTQKGWVGRTGALAELNEWNPRFSVWFWQKPELETVCFSSGWGRAAELPLVFWEGLGSSPEVVELNLSLI